VNRVVSYLVSASDLEFAVEVASAACQRQSIAVPGRNWRDDQVIDSVPLLISDSHQQALRDLPVNFDIPGTTSRILEAAYDRIRIRDGRNYLTRGIKIHQRAIGKLWECWSVQWHAIVKEPAAGFQERLPITCKRKSQRSTRSCVCGIGDRIAIKPQPEIEGQPGPGRPLIADEPGKFILMNRKNCGSAKVDSLQGRAQSANDVHRRELLSAVIRAVREIKANL